MKKIFLATTAIMSGIVLANGAHALTYNATTAVELRDALTMGEDTAMNFGVAQTSGSDVVVHLVDGASGGSTTATMIDTSTMSDGIYDITGSALVGATISIDATSANNEAGIAFTSIKCKYNGGASTELIGVGAISSGAAPGVGKQLDCDDVKIQITGGTAEGIYAPEIAFTVNYE